MIDKLKLLLYSDVEVIKRTATKAIEYKELYDKNQISKQEFEDLIIDLTRIERIDKELYTFDLYTKINQAFLIIRNIIMIIPFA